MKLESRASSIKEYERESLKCNKELDQGVKLHNNSTVVVKILSSYVGIYVLK